MSNYDIDEIERKERYERFDHAINCIAVSYTHLRAHET